MLRLLQNSRKALLSNCNPLSDIREFGTPNLVIKFFHTNFLTFTSRIFANASTATTTNRLLPVARGNGPRISNPHYANGQGLLTGFKCLASRWVRGGMFLTLLTSAYIFGGVPSHPRPPKSLSHCPVSQGATSHMTAAHPLMQFGQNFIYLPRM